MRWVATKKTNTLDELVKKQKLTCSCCGKEKRESEFYMSKAYIYKHIGRLPICKLCLGDVYDRYYNKYEDEKTALYYMCRATSICFNLSCFMGAMQEIAGGKKKSNVWQIYMTKLNSIGNKNGAGDDFDASDEIENTISSEEYDYDGDIQDNMRWGNLPKKDIEFLNNQFNSWITRHKCETRAEEILYEEICQMQLDIKKTRENGGDTVKKVEALQKLMASANIRPLDQNAMSVNENMMLWGTIVEAIEKNEPCEYFEEEKRKEYKDFKGYRSYFTNWVGRPLKNLLASHKDYNIIPDEEFDKDFVDEYEEVGDSTSE